MVFQPPAFRVPGGQLGRKWPGKLIGACAPQPLGWGQGAGWLHQPLVLRKNKGMRFLKVTWCVRDRQPQGGLCICLAFEERSKFPAPFSACWLQAPEMDFTPLCPPTRFLGNLWPRSLCLPWLARLLKNQGLERLGPSLSSCLRKINFVRCVLWPEFLAQQERGRGRAPQALPGPLPQASLCLLLARV